MEKTKKGKEPQNAAPSGGKNITTPSEETREPNVPNNVPAREFEWGATDIVDDLGHYLKHGGVIFFLAADKKGNFHEVEIASEFRVTECMEDLYTKAISYRVEFLCGNKVRDVVIPRKDLTPGGLVKYSETGAPFLDSKCNVHICTLVKEMAVRADHITLTNALEYMCSITSLKANCKFVNMGLL
jgi:hypothetical protein